LFGGAMAGCLLFCMGLFFTFCTLGVVKRFRADIQEMALGVVKANEGAIDSTPALPIWFADGFLYPITWAISFQKRFDLGWCHFRPIVFGEHLHAANPVYDCNADNVSGCHEAANGAEGFRGNIAQGISVTLGKLRFSFANECMSCRRCDNDQ